MEHAALIQVDGTDDPLTYSLLDEQNTPAMNSTASNAAETSAAGEHGATIVRASPAKVLRCLLVSVDQHNLDVLEAAAHSEGWLADRCAAITSAMQLAFRSKFHLAFIDIASTEAGELRIEFEQLASDLSRNHVPLLVISGDHTDPLAEIHARQLGVWLYLPGFDGKTELDVVFRDARAVHEKLTGPRPPDDRSRGKPDASAFADSAARIDGVGE